MDDLAVLGDERMTVRKLSVYSDGKMRVLRCVHSEELGCSKIFYHQS